MELPVRLRVHKDCHVERPRPEDFIPPSTDPITGVSSKNIVIFLPKITDPNEKLAVLVYFHGGAFVVNTPFTTRFHNLVTIIVSEANVVAVSVDYRKAPEHPIPAAYEDLWAALKWVASHSNEDELESCSSGVDMAHNLAMVAGNQEPGLSIGLLRIALVHPYIWGSVPIGSAIYPDEKVLASL
uniref:Alpha/beta hydrolase fold-3 domain-containing protein n=1 Tax=Populus trichocarpa TaxID=3694 RepID=A0A2K1XPT9_POPTR